MRATATILHLDLDAFFAAVEQRDKPSLRGKPVVVGGVGPRGVVATASYEARAFGIHSAMSTAEARRRCPHAAFLGGRFPAYRATSRAVMALLRSISPLVEPLSLDEAFVDLDGAELGDSSVPALYDFAATLKQQVMEVTGGLTGSVGIATSKLMAKIASDLDKPDGAVVVAPGTERDLLHPMDVAVIPGVGPATRETLRRAGVTTVADLAGLTAPELVGLLGRAHGQRLFDLARAKDDRAVEPDREAKSISVEDTYETDHTDRRLVEALVHRQALRVAERLRTARSSGRTVTLKVRLHDFSTHTRSSTLPAPTDDPRTIVRLASALLSEVDLSAGVRLLGVGVSGLADWIQEDLFEGADPAGGPGPATEPVADADDPDLEAVVAWGRNGPGWRPGMDVVHAAHGTGWVWGSGRGVVTVRFESATTGPGPVRSFAADDQDLAPLRQPDEDE